MQLVIAEKPSVARSISEVLGASEKKKGYIQGNGYIVSWCIGHLISLAEPEAYDEIYAQKPWRADILPILPKKWKFTVIKETKEQYDILKSLMQNNQVDKIVCATDAGREGECIFRYVYRLAGCSKPVKRLWISSVEQADIRQGFNNLKDISEYDRLYDSGFARTRADWLVGINATRLFSAVSGTFLSVGRVQTPTLAMIVQRESEIENFNKQKYFTVEIDCGEFTVCSNKIMDLSDAEDIRKITNDSTAFIKSISSESKNINPPQLYDLTALQKSANNLLGYTAQQTLNYAQSLYEKSLITYPRTDSRYVNASMTDKLTQLVNKSLNKFGIKTDDMPEPNISAVINDKKVSDHHALLPTLSAFNTEKIETVPESELKLLTLICAQLIYAVSEPHSYQTTSITISCENIDFTAKEKCITDMGWKKYQTKILSDLTGKETTTKDKIFSEIVEGLAFENVKSSIKEHWTAPPKHFTESSLLSAMEQAGQSESNEFVPEHAGLGSPATRSGIIETLIRRSYIQRSGKNLVPSAKGISLINAVPEEIKSPSLTSEWEEKLYSIEKGSLTPGEFMNGITEFVSELIHKYSDTNIRIERKVLGKCPKCGKNVVEYPKTYGCENGKNCGFVIWKTISGKKLTESAVSSLLERRKTVKIKGFKKKDGSGTFDAALIMNDNYTLSFKFK